MLTAVALVVTGVIYAVAYRFTPKVNPNNFSKERLFYNIRTGAIAFMMFTSVASITVGKHILTFSAISAILVVLGISDVGRAIYLNSLKRRM